MVIVLNCTGSNKLKGFAVEIILKSRALVYNETDAVSENEIKWL